MKPETAEWLEIAGRDIRGARSLIRDEHWLGAAYFCQQAIEKLLKGAVVERKNLDPPRIHDLVELADLVGVELTDDQRTFLTRLSDHAVRSRYPGADYDEEDVKELFQETERFFEWLRAKLP